MSWDYYLICNRCREKKFLVNEHGAGFDNEKIADFIVCHYGCGIVVGDLETEFKEMDNSKRDPKGDKYGR